VRVSPEGKDACATSNAKPIVSSLEFVLAFEIVEPFLLDFVKVNWRAGKRRGGNLKDSIS
jgi:hypothetical protein